MSVWRARGASLAQVGAMLHPGYAAGTWIGLRGTVNGGAYTYAADTLYAAPMPVLRRVRLDRLFINCTVGVASVLARLAVFDDAGRQPGAKLAETAAIDMSATGGKEADLTAAIVLPPGIHWFVAQFNGAAQATGYTNNNNTSETMMDYLGWPLATGQTASAGTGRHTRVTSAASYAGGMPAAFGTPTFGTAAVATPIIMARVA